MQVIGNEWHQKTGGIAVEENKAEGDGQYPDQSGFVFHPPSPSGIRTRLPNHP
jgi:hypothetical protein